MPTSNDLFKFDQDSIDNTLQTSEQLKTLNQIENNLQSYSLNDVAKSSSTPSLSTISSSSINQSTPDSLDLNNGFDVNNGIIHGHIHSFDNFTYIHGHIHTNDLSIINPLESSISSNPTTNSIHTLDSNAITFTKNPKKIPYHRHVNDSHSFEFSDCQHFEFLNCHDSEKNPILNFDENNQNDGSIRCNEDENCKPKIVEICCDDNHLQSNHFLPKLPQCADFHHSLSPNTDTSTTADGSGTSSQTSSSSDMHHDINQLFTSQNNNNNKIENFDCVTLDCGLDTCDLDDIYCKFCRDLDDIEGNKDFDDNKAKLNGFEVPTESHIHHKIIKRSRDEEDQSHTPPPQHFHHLHHNDHHSDTHHHHHHIQLHNHQTTKKPKTSVSSSNVIPFEWNLKSNWKCEWDDCSMIIDNPLNLSHHVLETHILSESPNIDLNKEGDFDCEWKNCDFYTKDLTDLLNHITLQHNYQNELNLSDLLIKKEIENDMLMKSEPSEKIISDSFVKRKTSGSEEEETTCKWMENPQTGEFISQCNLKFSSASELQDHLIRDHVGSGKSQYHCCWENCDRNHRSFNQRQKIIRHLHVHTRYKPFVCSICNHSFAVETMLEQHMRTHSGEKPYSCKTCGKQFATSSSLSIHIRTHTGKNH